MDRSLDETSIWMRPPIHPETIHLQIIQQNITCDVGEKPTGKNGYDMCKKWFHSRFVKKPMLSIPIWTSSPKLWQYEIGQASQPRVGINLYSVMLRDLQEQTAIKMDMEELKTTFLYSNKKLQEILFRIEAKRTFGSCSGKDEKPSLPKEAAMRIWIILEVHLTHSQKNEIELSWSNFVQ